MDQLWQNFQISWKWTLKPQEPGMNPVAAMEGVFLTSGVAHYKKIHQNNNFHLTPKHRETHGCEVSTVATDALVV